MTRRIAMFLLLVAVVTAALDADAAKRKSRPVVPPELKIVSIGIAPEPYQAGEGAMDFRIEVELPDETAAGTLLDVSALIASASKRSMRFIASREPVDAQTLSRGAARQNGKALVAVVLSWDGTDQSRRVVSAGKFSYEIRAKLLVNGDRGAHTQMTSWPKRGTVQVIERPGPKTSP